MEDLIKYKPINCNFYDYILEIVTLKRNVQIIYWNDDHTKKYTIQDIISDVYTSNKAEFLKLDSQKIIRLDRIISIEGKENNNQSCSIT